MTPSTNRTIKPRAPSPILKSNINTRRIPVPSIEIGPRRAQRLSLQRRAGPVHQFVVQVAGASQVDDARRQITVAPLRTDLLIILQHGRTEFVIVRVAAFEENEHAGGINNFLLL